MICFLTMFYGFTRPRRTILILC
ncbi:hypothetical protein RHECNPAF_470051 [Rhizobium etli CNPAF512]|nr:hypothetical protein RHECNPAF_470051 [Rhizobium etli CNPAF512]